MDQKEKTQNLDQIYNQNIIASRDTFNARPVISLDQNQSEISFTHQLSQSNGKNVEKDTRMVRKQLSAPSA